MESFFLYIFLKEGLKAMKVLKEEFGRIDNQTVFLFNLVNDHGVEIGCINYGCMITKIITPDKDGTLENVVVG
jgi:aldose 1-epimerase